MVPFMILGVLALGFVTFFILFASRENVTGLPAVSAQEPDNAELSSGNQEVRVSSVEGKRSMSGVPKVLGFWKMAFAVFVGNLITGLVIGLLYRTFWP